MLYRVTENDCVTYTVSHVSEDLARQHVREWGKENGAEGDEIYSVETLARDMELMIRFEGIEPITLTVEQWAAIYDGNREIICSSEW